MKRLMKVTLQSDDEFKKLLEEYETARDNLERYLFSEKIEMTELEKTDSPN